MREGKGLQKKTDGWINSPLHNIIIFVMSCELFVKGLGERVNENPNAEVY
jgi:hypothetical protein